MFLSTLQTWDMPSIQLTTPSVDTHHILWPKLDARYHARTLFLFTKSDFKTILMPVILFSTLLASHSSPSSIFAALIWIWVHLLHFCMANQCCSVSEDAANKPWRPIPSGRITSSQASHLRWALVPICLIISIPHGTLFPSIVLLCATWIYNDLGWHAHGLVKNVLNVIGYIAFEAGATIISDHEESLSSVTLGALCLSGLIILSTVHAGDIPDIEGDLKEGRRTFPIIFPNSTRPTLMIILLAWTLYTCSLLRPSSTVSSILLSLLGLAVAGRFLLLDSHQEDKLSCLLYNIWLAGVHVSIAIAAKRMHWDDISATI